MHKIYSKIAVSLLLLVFELLLGSTSQVIASESLYFIHQDHLGSTNLITNEQGQVTEKQVYFPFGETRQDYSLQQTANSKQISERKYTSQISDEDESGLYYYNARYYNPLLAKFTQADSAIDGTNRYAYVRNNPIIQNDLSGHQSARFDNEIIISNPNENQWKPPLPNPYGNVSKKYANLGYTLVAMLPTGLSLPSFIAFGAGMGMNEITAKNIDTTEFRNYQTQVYSDVNFEAKTELEFIKSLTAAIYNNTTYNPTVGTAYGYAREQGNKSPPFYSTIIPYIRNLFNPSVPNRITNGLGICTDFSDIGNYLLGQQGIYSEIMNSDDLNHQFLQINISGVEYIVDPTWNVVMPQTEHQKWLGITDYEPVGNFYEWDLEDEIAGKSTKEFFDFFNGPRVNPFGIAWQ